MLQSLRKDLGTYHDLFSGGRCLGWELEELMTRAIKSDTQAHHHVIWSEGGHDSEADLKVKVGDDAFLIQVKSGQVKNGFLVLSGYRMGRFKGDMKSMTTYLNEREADIVAVPYEAIEDKEKGKVHVYKLGYVGANLLAGLDWEKWEKPKASYEQVNQHGVMLSITPTMSWQVWWKIPVEIIDWTKEFRVC